MINIFNTKYLVVSNISITFAPELENNQQKRNLRT